MNRLYAISGISKQGFHKQIEKEFDKSLMREQIKKDVEAVRARHKNMGSRPMYYLLNIKDIGINKFEQSVSELGLGVKTKKNRTITTNSNHWYLKYPNLTNGIILTDVNQIWCSDITYYITADFVYYIVMIEDVYSRRILGWNASDNLYAENNLLVLKQAFKVRKCKKFNGLIHHSDKGVQYGCNDYVRMLKNAGIRISMANNSLENPYAERLNGIIKNDYLGNIANIGLLNLSRKLDQDVWLYNNERPHSELGYLTPVKFEETILRMPLDERPKLTLHDFRK